MSDKPAYPILGFDPDPEAIISPGPAEPIQNPPDHCVLCFFREVVETVAQEKKAKVFYSSVWESGEFKLYETEFMGKRIGFIHPGVGSALAASVMDELIGLGIKNFVACGGAGVLNAEIACGHLIVPDFAYRDEGASYHYQAPSEGLAFEPGVLKVITKLLEDRGVPYIQGATWSTDAPYRETKKKTAYFRERGCLSVEMEAAAFLAVAKFRTVNFGQILYGGDLVIESGWDNRAWQSRGEIRKNLFWLAAEACLAIPEEMHA